MRLLNLYSVHAVRILDTRDHDESSQMRNKTPLQCKILEQVYISVFSSQIHQCDELAVTFEFCSVKFTLVIEFKSIMEDVRLVQFAV